MRTDHDPMCSGAARFPDNDVLRDANCDCDLIDRVAKRTRLEVIDGGLDLVRKMLRDQQDDTAEQIAQAIEAAGLIWQVYLDNNPTDLERRYIWGRVEQSKGDEAIARRFKVRDVTAELLDDYDPVPGLVARGIMSDEPPDEEDNDE